MSDLRQSINQIPKAELWLNRLWATGRAFAALGFIFLFILAHIAFGPMVLTKNAPSGLGPFFLLSLFFVFFGGLVMASVSFRRWFLALRQ